jgi:hypothetical protein
MGVGMVPKIVLLYWAHHLLGVRIATYLTTIEQVTAQLLRPLSISQTLLGYEQSISCPKQELKGACASRRRQENVATSASLSSWLVKRGMRPVAMK